MLSADSSAKLLCNLTGIRHISVDCCKNSCIAYTGAYAELHSCPFCRHARQNTKNIPFRTFDYIPLTHRLRLQFANKERAQSLKNYPQSLEDNPWNGVRDYWDGRLHQEHKRRGFFKDPRDLALSVSADGVDLFNVGKYSIWPLVITSLNVDPRERVKKHNLMLCGIIPGPKNPRDIHSFLRPLIDKLKELANGISDVYDASTGTNFTLRAHLVLVTADLPAMSKLMGISGHGSYNHCRFCTAQGVYAGHVYCPLRTPHDTPQESVFNYDPANLTLRNNATYRHVANETLECENYNPNARPRPIYGVAQYSVFYELDTIDFPRSFPVDVMHLVFQNVVPKMYLWWTGTFLGSDENELGNEDELAMSKKTWREIGAEMEGSIKTIPSSFGKALRNIYLYSGSYKASEWSNFLLHYSSALLHVQHRGQHRLRRDLFEHFGKLVTAVSLAIDYDISHEDISNIKTLLVEFVSDYEKLYYQYKAERISACLATFHLLLHLHESLADCGPAWVFWQFPCERIVGMLKPLVKNRSQGNCNLSLAILR